MKYHRRVMLVVVDPNSGIEHALTYVPGARAQLLIKTNRAEVHERKKKIVFAIRLNQRSCEVDCQAGSFGIHRRNSDPGTRTSDGKVITGSLSAGVIFEHKNPTPWREQ